MFNWLSSSSLFPFLTEPKFNLDKSYYLVDESAGFLNIRVKRSGPDLSVDSSVLFATRQLFPVSARGKFTLFS